MQRWKIKVTKDHSGYEASVIPDPSIGFFQVHSWTPPARTARATRLEAIQNLHQELTEALNEATFEILKERLATTT